MKAKSVVALLTLLAAGSLAAQQDQKISVAYGTPDDRASTRLVYWTATGTAGEFAFNYGRPLWKKDYEDPAKFDSITKGKVWRLGNNFWTELATDIPLTISGKSIAPGIYFLGLQRSEDGASWSLAFYDPAKVRHAHIDAFYIANATPDFFAPMKLDAPSMPPVEKLTFTITHPASDLQNAALKIAWGTLALSAPVKVQVAD